MASRLSRSPLRDGKSGASPDSARSLSQASRALTVSRRSGVQRCLRPLPSHRICAPAPGTKSDNEDSPVPIRAARFGQPTARSHGPCGQPRLPGPAPPAALPFLYDRENLSLAERNACWASRESFGNGAWKRVHSLPQIGRRIGLRPNAYFGCGHCCGVPFRYG